MANMTTRAIASVAERNAATSFFWGHTGSGPTADRRYAVTDFVTKDANGNAGLGTSAPATTSGRNMTISSAESSLYLASSGGRSYVIASGGNFQFSPNSLCFYSNFHGGNAWLMDGNLHLLPGGDAARNFGAASARINNSFFAVAPTVTSDERAKTEITEIPDAWLDAWADVQRQRFKMVGGNRWHVGLIAQQVHAAFAAHDLDAFEIGLCCYDKWDEVREPIYETVTKTRKATRTELAPAGNEIDGEPLYRMVEVEFDEEYEESIDTGKTRVILEAGDRWGLRYDECHEMDAAFEARRIARIEARLAELDKA